jgi:uncharacterized protein with GYD domain
MPTKIICLKLTEEGAKSLKQSRERYREAIRGLEAAGGKLLGAWAVEGPYDFVLALDVPDDRAGFALAATAAMRGTSRTETWTALPIDDFYALVERL